MDAVTGLMEALKAGGPYAMAAIFILGWWLERLRQGLVVNRVLIEVLADVVTSLR